MVLLNELLEEGAGRTVEFTQHIDGAARAIDELVKRAQSLADRVAAEGDEAHQELQAALTSLEQAEQELGAATEETDGHLETLATRAADVRGRAGELLAQVRKGVDELESFKEQLEARLQQRMQAAEDDFEGLDEHLDHLQAALDEKLQAAEDAVEAFHEALAQANQEFEEAQTRILEHVRGLEEAVLEELKAYSEAIDNGLSGAVEDLLETANKMIAEHNEAAQAIAHKFAQEAVDRLTSSFEPLKAAADAVAQWCEDSEQALAAKAPQVLEKVEEALQIVERIRPALEAAERLA